ncbi:hypothetical protein FRC17_000973 [Serendipita sp. 399]|nr:hypothetical protein FRC17_000973 [Serendipita sp. 399]
MPYNEMKETLRTLDTLLHLPPQVEDLNRYLSHIRSSHSMSSAAQDDNCIQEEDVISLESQERHIIDISEELTSLLQGYTTSVISLARRCAQTSPNCAFGPRVPDDIIIHILRYVVEDGSHHIKPLLLVNRRFHDVIMSDPVLWSKVTIVVNTRLQEVNGLSMAYLKTCLERSRGTQLDVRLDFSSASGIYEYFSSIQEEFRHNMPSFSLPLTSDSHFRGIYRDPGYTKELEKLKKLIRMATTQMNRWQTATIFFPTLDEEELTDIFKRLFLPSLMISRLTGEFIQTYCQNGFPRLSNIKNFILWGPSKIGRIVLNSGRMRELSYEATSRDPSLYKLSSCTDLQVLVIYAYSSDLNPSLSPLVISLPSLIELGVIDSLDGLMGIEF